MTRSLIPSVAEAKASLRDADLTGETLQALVDAAISELCKLRGQASDVREVLREHGHNPNGKRLPDAVDEALRHTMPRP